MIVAQRLRGSPDPEIMNPRSRTMMFSPTAQYVAQTRASMDTPNLEVRRLNGITDGLPAWLPWAAGGLALGLVGGYAVYRARKKRR